MKITGATTLAELEIHLRAFGLACSVRIEPGDQYFVAHVLDADGAQNTERGATLPEAIASAIESYMIGRFGPRPGVKS